MSLSGTITTYPLPDLLQWLAMTRKTGIVSLVSGEITVTLVFRDGILLTASSSDASRRLGQYLLAQGLITEPQLAEVLDLQAGDMDGQRLGQILTEREFLSEDDISGALRDGTREIVYDLFLLEEAMFHFSPEIQPPEGSILVELNIRVDSLIMEGARRLDEWQRFREVLPSDGTRIRRTSSAPPSPGAPELWGVLLWLLQRPHSVGELIVASRRSAFEVYEALYAMHGKRIIEASETSGEVREATIDELSPSDLEAEIQRFVDGRSFDRALARIAQLREQALENEWLSDLAVLVAEEEVRFLKGEFPSDATPALAVGLDQLQRLEMNPKDAFLLSRLGESMDIRTLCMILPMTELEVLRAMFALCEKGVIRIS